MKRDPHRAEWSKAARVIADRDYLSHAIQGKPMETHSRWTKENLYLLYICPYDELNLKPNPDPNNETPQRLELASRGGVHRIRPSAHRTLQGV